MLGFLAANRGFCVRQSGLAQESEKSVESPRGLPNNIVSTGVVCTRQSPKSVSCVAPAREL